ncbi:MAG: L-rhamnose mutarotase [Niabella sp.]|nr:L-rhamnose mutarotase [Niabella sp.]
MHIKKTTCFYLIVLGMLAAAASCKRQKMEEHVFVVNIAAGDQKLQEYLDHHQHIWPEVEAGFKKAGYKKITLSRYQHLIVMSVLVPAGASLDSMGRIAEASNKRCAEWNQLMNTYQEGVPGTMPGQKWVEVKPFYNFENEK